MKSSNSNLILLVLVGLTAICSANENSVFLYNRIDLCKSTQYYDVNYFLCRECDAQLNLVPSQNGKNLKKSQVNKVNYENDMIYLLFPGLQCECSKTSSINVEYDSNVRQPVCVSLNCTKPGECAIAIKKYSQCGLRHLIEVVSTSPPSKSIQIQRIPPKRINNSLLANIFCSLDDLNAFECSDPKEYVRFKDFCFPNYLIRDFLNYRQFSAARPDVFTAFSVNLFENLEFVVFLCHMMRISEYCEHVANLCVLTIYNADKFSPCNIFYATQTALISNGIDNFQAKLTPFLFYAKGRSASDELDKIIDYRYQYFKTRVDSGVFDIFGRHSVSKASDLLAKQ